jgi:hypothetical protein
MCDRTSSFDIIDHNWLGVAMVKKTVHNIQSIITNALHSQWRELVRGENWYVARIVNWRELVPGEN